MPPILGGVHLRRRAPDPKRGGQRAAPVLPEARALKEGDQPIPQDLGDLAARVPNDVQETREVAFNDPVHFPWRKVFAEPRAAFNVGEQYRHVAEPFEAIEFHGGSLPSTFTRAYAPNS